MTGPGVGEAVAVGGTGEGVEVDVGNRGVGGRTVRVTVGDGATVSGGGCAVGVGPVQAESKTSTRPKKRAFIGSIIAYVMRIPERVNSKW